MTSSKSIGPIHVPQPYSIKDIPALIVGGAVFNTQYSTNPRAMPVKDIVLHGFSQGLIAIDTSPYYGVSEELLGDALRELKPEWPRESYFICTKAGRVKLDEFDYSREAVRKLVERSLKRLDSAYLDLVYMHDIEFVETEQTLEALRELNQLKKEGLVKNIGISGYPVKYLYKVALASQKCPGIGPVDAVLSYSNGCLQNEILFEYYERFVAAGVQKVLNGSILSMSLLRSGVTHSFHPASQALRDRVQEVAVFVKENYNGMELADLATRFALRKWLFETEKQLHTELEWNKDTSIVLGVSNVEELKAAITNYWMVKQNEGGINDKDVAIFAKVKELLGEHFNETWASGIQNP